MFPHSLVDPFCCTEYREDIPCFGGLSLLWYPARVCAEVFRGPPKVGPGLEFRCYIIPAT